MYCARLRYNNKNAITVMVFEFGSSILWVMKLKITIFGYTAPDPIYFGVVDLFFCKFGFLLKNLHMLVLDNCLFEDLKVTMVETA